MNDDPLEVMQELRKVASGKGLFNITENRTWWYRAVQNAELKNFGGMISAIPSVAIGLRSA